MAQIRSALDEVRTPFIKMSFTPDVPTSGLGANEYNQGLNVETDVRGIKSVLGDEEIFTAFAGTPTYITGGYREDGNFYYIVAITNQANEGRWYEINGTTATNITPGVGANPYAYLSGYTTNVNITEAWNGTTLIVNDAIHPPMFLQSTATEFQVYSLTEDATVYNIYPQNTATMIIETNEDLTTLNVPYQVGDVINLSGVSYPAVNGNYTIISTLTNNNYNLEVAIPTSAYTAQFIGEIQGTTLTVLTMISGTIGIDELVCAGSVVYDTSISGYGTGSGGTGTYLISQSQTISTSTMATIGRYASGGLVRPQYQWNYNPDWKELSAGFMRVFSSPNVGSLLIAGNLTATDLNNNVYNFPNTVRWSQNFGLNQVPATWIPTVFNVANELEVPLRGPVLDGFPCNGNFFVCSYWDTVVFSPINYQTTQVPVLGVKLYNQGRGLLNSNCWVNADDTVYGLDARDLWVFNGQDFRPLGNQRIKNYFYKNLNPLYTNQVFLEFNAVKNQIEIYYPDLTSTGYCNRMISYRYDLDVFNPPREVPDVIMATEGPIYRLSPYNAFDPGSRTVAYVRAVYGSKVVQKDQAYSFINNTPISTLFRRDSVKLVDGYSYSSMVHRIYPEIYTIDLTGQTIASTGTINITIGGSNSAGQSASFKPTINFPINTDNPWVQINQNQWRVNTVKIESTSTSTAWIVPALTWQFTPVEDAR